MSIVGESCSLNLKRTDGWSWKWPLWSYNLPYLKVSNFNAEYIKR